MPKKKGINKNISRKIPVIKLEERREDQVKSPREYKPTISKMYKDEKGKPLDLTRLEKLKKNRKSFYLKIIIILLVLFAITLAGFFVFFREKKFKEGDVVLNIEGSKNIASGDEITYTIQYLNQGQAFLGNLELTLTYPEGFAFKSSEPESDNTYNQYWTLGNLSSGKGGEVKISGQMIGEVGSTNIIKAKLSYKPSNFNAIFETTASFSTQITSSIIDLEIEGPKRVIPEEEVTFKVKYKNDSTEALEKLRIIATYPDDFTFKSSIPDLYEENNTWQIERLEAGNGGEIEIKGVFSGQAGEMEELKFKIGLILEGGEFSPQVEESILVLLITPEFTLSLQVNGSSEDTFVNPGEILTFYLAYKNNSDLEVTDLALKAELTSDVLNWSSLEDDLEGQVEEGIITWTKDQIEGLASLKPDDEGEIIFKIKVNDSISLAGSDDKNYQIESVFKGTSSAIEDLGGESLEVESNKIIIKINSQVKVSCEARYYSEENEQLGTGPLPPEVSKTTTYRIFWYLSNTTNEVTDVEIKSTLPEDIYWTGKNKSVSSGTLSFDPTSRAVTWNVNKIPVGTGQVFSQLSVSFEVSTTPKAADVGLVKILTDKATLSATDSFTQVKLNSNCDSLTSDLINDIYAQGKGIVVESQN